MEPIVPQEDGPGPQLAAMDSTEGASETADNYPIGMTARAAPLADA